MTAPERMHRLLMGDVGTGKTVVALFAMLLAVENDFQAALMAPTELLAEQHGATLEPLLAPLELKPELLLGRPDRGGEGGGARSGSRRARRGWWSALTRCCRRASSFQRLGLVVIDEQHRFGVEQRAALIGKGAAPDVLLLTATPIPRSLALTLYGDLDVSTLQGAPAGAGRRCAPRSGAASQRERVLEFVAQRMRGRAAGLYRVAGHRRVGAGRSPGGHDDGAEPGGSLARARGRPGAWAAQGRGAGRRSCAASGPARSRCWWRRP